MHEMHSRNRERAVAAITQKNNLQSMVDELEKQISNLQAKAEFALKKGERDLAMQLLTEKQTIESSLGSTKDALTNAIETSEQVKEHIKREEEMIRRKTVEALQLKAQWKSAQIQNEMEKALGAMGQFEQAETSFGRAKEKITQTHHESRARAELGKGRVETRLAGLEDIERSAAAEAELAELDDADALELLESIGLTEPGLATLARVGFSTLGLQTYLTAGPKEARAWTISQGATAPEAAGVIHTDFQRGFIKAEIVSFTDLVDAGSMAEAKARGKVRMEGKEYVMADGDVVEFRFNV
jgi:phage shock protein A